MSLRIWSLAAKLLVEASTIFCHKYYALIIINYGSFFFFLPVSIVFFGLCSKGGSAGGKSRSWNYLVQTLGRVEISGEISLLFLLCFKETPAYTALSRGLSAVPWGCFQGFTPCCRLELGKQDCLPEGIYCLTCLNINMIKQKLDEFINHNLIKGWLVIFMVENNSLLHLVQQKRVFAARLCLFSACSVSSSASHMQWAKREPRWKSGTNSSCMFHPTQMKLSICHLFNQCNLPNVDNYFF